MKFDVYTSVTVGNVDTVADTFSLFYPTPNNMELVYIRMVLAEIQGATDPPDVGGVFIPTLLPENYNAFQIVYASSGSGIVTSRSDIGVNLFSCWEGRVLLRPDMSDNGRLGDFQFNVINDAVTVAYGLNVFFGFNFAPDGK